MPHCLHLFPGCSICKTGFFLDLSLVKNASKFMSISTHNDLEFLSGTTTTNKPIRYQMRGDTEPMQSRSHIFDSTLGFPSDNWLDRRQLRRELTDNLERESMSAKNESAQNMAQNFLDELSRKAQLRDGISRKSEELKRQQEETLRRQAAEYRERLRRLMPPSLREPDRK